MSGRALAVRFSLDTLCSIPGRSKVLAEGAIVLIIAVAAGGPRAQAGAAISSDPVFKAQLIDGRTVSGRLASLGPGSIRLVSTEGKTVELPLNRFVKLGRDAATVRPALDASHVIFPEGDRLMRVAIGSSTETSLEIQSDALGKLSVPLDGILGLLFANESQAPLFDSLWEQVRSEPRSTEVVWLTNGDRLTGGFLALDEGKIKIQVAGKPALVDRPAVVALGFDPKLVSYPRPQSDFLELTLRDGSRLGVSEARLEDGMILATTRYGAPIKISLNELVRVYGRSSSLVYLSERKVFRDQYLPYVGPTREYRIDRTVDGHIFHLSGQSFDRGIGTQSTTFLAYKIEPGDRRFQALVGVDDRAGPLGSVVFRVLVDGAERFKTPPMTDHDTPRAVDVDLLGAKFVILATEFGDRGDVRDLADWVEARIVR
jgi:NPCBM/NEW2 domain